MTLLLLLSAFAAEPRWAGIPLTQLPALSLSTPDLSARADVWQAADATGGWVRVSWYPDEAAAKASFTFQTTAGTTRVQPALTVPSADEAIGDTAYVMARSRNVVIMVRAQDEQAPARAASMLAALRPEGTVVAAPTTVDAAVWDGFGRRLAALPK